MTSDPPDLNLGLLLFIPYRFMESAVMAALKAAGHDLSLSQARVFQRISPEGSRPAELAEAAQISKQTLSSIVDQLERDVRRAAGKFVSERTKRRPMIVPVVMEA